VKSKSVMVWLVAMLLAVMVALWPAEHPRSLDAVRVGVMVDGGIEELATTIEAKEKGNSIRPRETLIEVGGQQVEPVQQPRVHTVRRTARGPPGEGVGDACERRPWSEW
jgi:hypothetical protein